MLVEKVKSAQCWVFAALRRGGGNERTTTIIKTVVLDSKTETEQYTTTN